MKRILQTLEDLIDRFLLGKEPVMYISHSRIRQELQRYQEIEDHDEGYITSVQNRIRRGARPHIQLVSTIGKKAFIEEVR